MTKKSVKTKGIALKKLKPGEYKCTVVSAKRILKGVYQMVMKLDRPNTPEHNTHIKTIFNTIPVDDNIDINYCGEGHNCYFVACEKLGIYTSIGADNIHHASNKATKLFGAHWGFLRPHNNCHELMGYQHFPVAEFGGLIKTLQN